MFWTPIFVRWRGSFAIGCCVSGPGGGGGDSKVPLSLLGVGGVTAAGASSPSSSSPPSSSPPSSSSSSIDPFFTPAPPMRSCCWRTIRRGAARARRACCCGVRKELAVLEWCAPPTYLTLLHQSRAQLHSTCCGIITYSTFSALPCCLPRGAAASLVPAGTST